MKYFYYISFQYLFLLQILLKKFDHITLKIYYELIKYTFYITKKKTVKSDLYRCLQ